MLDRDYAPHGLRGFILLQIEEARREGISDNLIEWGVEQVLFAGRRNSELHKKPVEYYLHRSVERRHFLNYVRGVKRAAEEVPEESGSPS